MVLLAGMVALSSSCSRGQQMPLKCRPTTDVYKGWRLGVQAYTFNRFTFYEAVDKAAELGLDWIEAYPSQQLSRGRADVKFVHTMPARIRQEVKHKLAESGVKLVNYGVVGLPNNEAECRKVFDFAKDMGVETIVSEPPAEAFELIERLCKEYKIKVAIHNHPKPSRYWHPDKVLEACKGRSKWIGACADTGHWMRSGINPLEALKKLEGRIISLHLKDLNEFGNPRAHDVIWGTGKGDVEAMLSELDRQNFEGVFSIEYEYHWENSVPEIRRCVEYFNRMAGELKPTDWRDLLAEDLSNCLYKPGSWAMEDGVFTRKGGGNIWTKEEYGDFVLDLEFKVAKGSNSGVFFRGGDIDSREWWQSTIEVQIHDTTDGTKYGACGAIYDCLPPSKNVVRKTGEWNRMTITAQGSLIKVVMNGEQIIDMDLDLWTEAHKNPDGTPNKFGTAYKDMPRVGKIGFQDHGDPVWYRNIKIRELPSCEGWRDLLAKDLSNCVYEQSCSWVVEPDGVLSAKGGGDIWTKERYGDFILELEFKLAEGTNSGVFLRTGSLEEWLHTAIEVQVLDSYGKSKAGKHDCGAIFDCLAPSKNMVKRPGEWNHYTITCKANKICVVLNGEQIIDMDLDLWTKAHKNPDGTPNKFNTAYRDMPREGHIGLQYHGQPIWYRNIKIKTLAD